MLWENAGDEVVITAAAARVANFKFIQSFLFKPLGDAFSAAYASDETHRINNYPDRANIGKPNY